MIESNLIVRRVEGVDFGIKPSLPTNLGPGPIELIGWNGTSGFFGEVPINELISGDALASTIGLAFGTSQNPNEPWLKFLLDDRILFIAKKNYRYNLSWNHIHAANAVFGDKIIEIKGYQFRVSLIKGLNPDPSVPFVDGSYDNECSWNSEWNRLMYHVAIDNPTYPKTSQVGPNWANYPQDDSTDGLNMSAGNGRCSWCQEVSPIDTLRRIQRGYNSVSITNTQPANGRHSSYGWRPSLELV